MIIRSPYQIIELRQYTMRPGRRDVLIDLFERKFMELQATLGIEVIGYYRDLDDADRFVWLRGFADMPARATATTAFYESEIWLANRDAANATLVDTDNVLLLHPTSPGCSFPSNGNNLPVGSVSGAPCLVVATIVSLIPAMESEFPTFFVSQMAPALSETRAEILATYATEHSPNNYPRLPIREGEHVFVWLSRFADAETYKRHLAALSRSPHWQREIVPELARRTQCAPDVLRLIPVALLRFRSSVEITDQAGSASASSLP